MSAPAWHDADGVDYRRLRSERLGRFQEAMRARDVAACLLFHPANIRYTTGTAVMDIYSTVKLEDQVLLTANGAELLSAFPFDGRLLGGR